MIFAFDLGLLFIIVLLLFGLLIFIVDIFERLFCKHEWKIISVNEYHMISECQKCGKRKTQKVKVFK